MSLIKLLKKFNGIIIIISFLITLLSLVFSDILIFIIGISLTIIASIFLLVNYYKNRKRKKYRSNFDSLRVHSKSYIRGLKPFEQGEQLFGRNSDVLKINSIIDADNFKFGYLSGEAGVGKTSLIRAGVMSNFASANKLIFYISSVKSNPINAIEDVLFKDTKHREDIKTYLIKNYKTKKVIFILDQFEEFFVSVKSFSKRSMIIEELSSLVLDAGTDISIFISIRKDFVDDLQEFAPKIEQPTDHRFSMRLKKWDSQTASEIFLKMVRKDKLNISESLCKEVISDLSNNGLISPVEIQIVGQILDQNQILDLHLYKTAGRASTILSNFIKDYIINITVTTNQSLEKDICRFFLRNLCSIENDAKKSEGETIIRLLKETKETIVKYDKKLLVDDGKQFEEIFYKVIEKCFKEYIIVYEKGNKINLAHDYIVPAIKKATVDIETNEELANKLLFKYLENSRVYTKFRIPLKKYFFIKKFASKNLISELNIRKLLKKSLNLYIIRTILLLVIFILSLIFIFPPKDILISQDCIDIEYSNWFVNYKDHLGISINDSRNLKVWNLKNLSVIDEPNITFESYFPSRNASWFFLSDSSKSYLYNVGAQEISNSYLDSFPTNYGTGLYSNNGISDYSVSRVEFSPDESWLSMITSDGQFYLYNLDSMKLVKKISLFKSSWNTRRLLFSENSRYLFIHDFDFDRKYQRLFIFDLNNLYFRIFEFKHSDFYLDEGNSITPFVSPNGEYIVLIRKLDMYFFKFSQLLEPIYYDIVPFFTLEKNAKIKEKEKNIFGSSGGHIAYSVAFTPDSKYLLFSTDNKDYSYRYSLNIFSTETNEGFRIPPFTLESFFPFEISISNDCNSFILNTDGINIFYYDLQKKKVLYYKHSSRKPNFWSEYLFSFSPNNHYIASNNESGRVYCWQVDSSVNLDDYIAYYPRNSNIRIYWDESSEYLFTYSNNEINFGKIYEPLTSERVKSDIQNIVVSSDQEKLIVLESENVEILKKKKLIWGFLPVYSFKWPKMYNPKSFFEKDLYFYR